MNDIKDQKKWKNKIKTMLDTAELNNSKIHCDEITFLIRTAIKGTRFKYKDVTLDASLARRMYYDDPQNNQSYRITIESIGGG